VYFGNRYDRAKIVDGLGQQYTGGLTLYKRWPAVGTAHSHIHATMELVKEHDLQPEQIREIKAFVGDYIGHFQPGHLVLTGPRVPHNWISSDAPPGGVALRDRVIQFAHEPIEQACELFPEFKEILPLLEQARYGIEFFGVSEMAQAHFERVAASRGLARIAGFCEFMGMLARCKEFRLLSSVKLQCAEDDESMAQVNAVVSYISEHCGEPLSMAEVCARFRMPESRFSRFFRRATGNTFTDFVNLVRVNRACQLLMETDRQVTRICYEVGFNNVANFNRRFREIKGMTPSEFRHQAEHRFGRGI